MVAGNAYLKRDGFAKETGVNDVNIAFADGFHHSKICFRVLTKSNRSAHTYLCPLTL